MGPAEQGSGHAVKAAVQKVAFDNGGAFIRETRREVEQYLARGNTRLNGLLLLYAKAPVAIGLIAASWTVLVFARTGLIAGFLCLAGLVLGAMLNAFCVQHDANHGAYFRRRRYNNLVGWTADALLGFSSYAWRVKHNVAHHTYTNIDGYDADASQCRSPGLRRRRRRGRGTDSSTTTSGRCTR